MCIKPACAWQPAAAGTRWAERAERSCGAERPRSCPCRRGNMGNKGNKGISRERSHRLAKQPCADPVGAGG